jgi:hypothetical protein
MFAVAEHDSASGAGWGAAVSRSGERAWRYWASASRAILSCLRAGVCTRGIDQVPVGCHALTVEPAKGNTGRRVLEAGDTYR